MFFQGTCNKIVLGVCQPFPVWLLNRGILPR